MADYKDIIMGTFHSVVDKVKEVTESGTVRDIYDNGVSRAKSLGSMAKLMLEANGEGEELKKVYTEIGRMYYEQTETPEGVFVPLFEQAAKLAESIEEKQETLRAMKEQLSPQEKDIDVEVCEFDEVVSEEEKNK